MRKLLGTITLVVIIIAIIGSKRDWFTLSRTAHGTHTDVQLHIDREKIRQDAAQARSVARELRENIEQKLEQKPQP